MVSNGLVICDLQSTTATTTMARSPKMTRGKLYLPCLPAPHHHHHAVAPSNRHRTTQSCLFEGDTAKERLRDVGGE